MFLMCKQKVGHYHPAGWLHVAYSYVKRKAEGANWGEKMGERSVKMMKEILERVTKEDPVRRHWYVPRLKSGIIWCDTSSISMGVILEIGGVEVKDAAWLRKKEDVNHINVTKLGAMSKGVNLTLGSELHDIQLYTNSTTVLGWVDIVITKQKRGHPKQRGHPKGTS